MTEITVWLVRCALVPTALTAGALIWEARTRSSGGPARWAWLGALAGSVVLPLLLPLLPALTLGEAVPVMNVVRLERLVLSPATAADPAISMGVIALAVWVFLSAATMVYTTALQVRLAQARRAWRRAEVDGTTVLVSRNTGPAAVGIRRADVVIPRWGLALDAELRRLMLLHEREHVHAGDPRLLLAALALVTLMPWHPLVWLQFRRLRNAIELDCDARVLRGGIDPRRYGSLLLEIGRRRGSNSLALATLAEPHAFLATRIRRIAQWPLPRRPLRAAVLSVIACALFSAALLACVESAGPEEGNSALVQTPPNESRAVQRHSDDVAVQQKRAVAEGPTFTPFTVAPELQNTADVQRTLEALYPPLVRAAGIGGTVLLWFLIDENGKVVKTQVKESSGHAPLDAAAAKIAAVMQFSPAINRDRKVPVWVAMPIRFAPK